MTFDDSQLSAISAACSRRFAIINGGPGTGKTTIMAEVTRRLEAEGESVLLAAFAGKAAARLREATKHQASTIHRMLGYNGSVFQVETLRGRVVIIDEASMVDSLLMAEIVRREPKRLILVGDEAQLPPVGRGQPFHDLIRYRPDLVSSLSTCYRATEAVFMAATAIRSGGRPPIQARSDGERWNMLNTGDQARTQKQILAWIEAGAFDFNEDVILVARNGETRDEPCTVRGLNQAVVDMIRPRDEKTKFCVGDRIINTKNLPDLDFWNGTTGEIHAIDQDGGIWIDPDTPAIDWGRTRDANDPVYAEYVLFTREQRKHLQLAYALTVHKAQGSQYRNVCVAAFMRDTWGLLDRSLLYTGITRTQTACCVVGELGAVWAAIDKVNHKRTVIQQLADGVE